MPRIALSPPCAFASLAWDICEKHATRASRAIQFKCKDPKPEALGPCVGRRATGDLAQEVGVCFGWFKAWSFKGSTLNPLNPKRPKGAPNASQTNPEKPSDCFSQIQFIEFKAQIVLSDYEHPDCRNSKNTQFGKLRLGGPAWGAVPEFKG